MPDIAMCKGEGCTIKEECYRYTAKPNEYRQTYFTKPPFVEKFTGSSCDYFWEAKRPLVIKKESE